jgi:hypothetical protein
MLHLLVHDYSERRDHLMVLLITLHLNQFTLVIQILMVLKFMVIDHNLSGNGMTKTARDYKWLHYH